VISAIGELTQTSTRSFQSSPVYSIQNHESRAMPDIKEIVADYRNADDERRLYLWLTHIDLREEFLDISMSNRQIAQRSPTPEKKKKAFIGVWRNLIRRASYSIVGF
jgi:hypothetical protein